jgi:hypothetical protein
MGLTKNCIDSYLDTNSKTLSKNKKEHYKEVGGIQAVLR